MKIYGHPFLYAVHYPVYLLREPDNEAIARADVVFTDLWRSDRLHEGLPGEPGGAYQCVALRGPQFPEVAEINVDVLDEESAWRVADLFNDVHAAEQALLDALRPDPRPAAEREQSLDQVETLGRRWASLTRPVPCTLDILDRSQAVAARVHGDREQLVLAQDQAGADTVFWSLYERQANGSSQACIDVVDMDDARLVDMARLQLESLRTFAMQLRADPALALNYEEMDVHPVGWPSMNDSGVPQWLEALAARGLDFDPGAEDLAAAFSVSRDADGELRMGRRAAHRLAWEISYVGQAGIFTIEDLREMAAPHMPAAAAAMTQKVMP